jgi:NADPH-dependent ferric siderophore reductase
MIEDRGHPREWMKAAGYWARGKADGGAKIED